MLRTYLFPVRGLICVAFLLFVYVTSPPAAPTDTIGAIPDYDWATYQNDQQRTGRTDATLGDANCDLTAVWTFEDTVNGSYFAGPIIKDGKVIQAFRDRYRIFDLATGAILHEIVTGGDQVFCTPAIYSIYLEGESENVLFVGYGAFADGGAVAAYLWNDIAAGPIWVSEDPRGCWESRYGGFTVLDIAGEDILFFERGERSVHAVYAATGEVFPGWNGEIFQQIGFGCNYRITSITTDGVDKIFVSVATSGFPGDVYAINAFTGEEEWRLSTAGGLQASAMYGIGFNDEGFQAGLSFDYLTNTLFAHSHVTGTYPVDGILYALEPETGEIKWVTPGNRVFNGTPVIGHNLVHIPTFTRWLESPMGGNMVTYRKLDGVPHWVANDALMGRYPKEAILTTGYGADPDLLIALDESGRLHFFDAEMGETVMYRQVRKNSDRENYGMCAAIEDTLVVTTYYGSITMLAVSSDRPRLQLNEPRFAAEIPLSAESEVVVTFEDAYANAGCADLNITLIADKISNGTYDPTFSGSLFPKIDSFEKDGVTPRPGGKPIPLDPTTTARPSMNSNSQAGPPAYLVASSWSDIAAAGETKDLQIRVNPSLMARGVYRFYIQFDSDDPDYFINDPTLVPEILVQLTYGCALDTTTLHFGVGGANEQLVSNTGRLGSRDWEDSPAGHMGFRIDGEGDEYFQGAFIYGVSQHRLAMNSRDWTAYGTETGGGQYRSLMPDPNYIDGDCKPAIRTSIAVPDWSLDGITYHAFEASAVYSTFIDSVQLFFDYLGNWDWSAVGDPFEGAYDNDSTIGTITNSRTIGVIDSPTGAGLQYLNQGTIQVLEIASRNGQTVSDLGIGHFCDHDMAVVDTTHINRDISSAWACGFPPHTNSLGVVKIPFGVGHEPLYNQAVMFGPYGFWRHAYWDSAYYYMQSLPEGQHVQLNPFGEMDVQSHVTLVHDYTLIPGETLTLAQVVFRLGGIDYRSSEPDEIIALANVFNKFAGFGRGDMNNDNEVNIADVVMLADHVVREGRGAVPFAHLADVNADDMIDMTDVVYLMDYYFNGGPPPAGDWEI